jgi:hypothetical protein
VQHQQISVHAEPRAPPHEDSNAVAAPGQADQKLSTVAQAHGSEEKMVADWAAKGHGSEAKLLANWAAKTQAPQSKSKDPMKVQHHPQKNEEDEVTIVEVPPAKYAISMDSDGKCESVVNNWKEAAKATSSASLLSDNLMVRDSRTAEMVALGHTREDAEIALSQHVTVQKASEWIQQHPEELKKVKETRAVKLKRESSVAQKMGEDILHTLPDKSPRAVMLESVLSRGHSPSLDDYTAVTTF